MSDAVSAQGTYIGKGDGASPENFTEIAEVVSIGGPNETSDEIEVTHLRSTGGYREFLQSFKDGGECPLNLNFIPGNATQDAITGLRSEFQSGARKNYRITFPDTSTCLFAAFVKGIGTTIAVGDKLGLDVTLRIVGATYWVEV